MMLCPSMPAQTESSNGTLSIALLLYPSYQDEPRNGGSFLSRGERRRRIIYNEDGDTIGGGRRKLYEAPMTVSHFIKELFEPITDTQIDTYGLMAQPSLLRWNGMRWEPKRAMNNQPMNTPEARISPLKWGECQISTTKRRHKLSGSHIREKEPPNKATYQNRLRRDRDKV